MPLKTVVKVGNISNLSDARYCSGMGVDMLGFSVVEGQANYLSPKLFQEIRGWISGPKVVAEIYGIKSNEQILEIVKNYAPDYFELSRQEYIKQQSILHLPCIVDISGEELSDSSSDQKIIYYQTDNINELRSHGHPLLLKNVSATDVMEKIINENVAGISLSGNGEIRPGYKTYEGLAEILELLDDN